MTERERFLKINSRKPEPQDTLARRISQKKPLTEAEQIALLDILGSHCQARTKRMLAGALSWVPNILNQGIYRRVHLSPRVSYCAGQSYPDEIRTVRKCLIGC